MIKRFVAMILVLYKEAKGELNAKQLYNLVDRLTLKPKINYSQKQ